MIKLRKITLYVVIRCICVAALILALVPTPAMAAGTCGTGTWTSGNLEIHHINIGQGDAILIVGPTGKSLLFDAGESYWNSSANAQTIGSYIETVLGCNELDYVVISHFHLDHIGYVGYGGLYHLVETQGFTVGATLVRDYNSYLGDISGTFTNWKTYLEGTGQAKLHPVTAIEGSSQVDLGTGVTFDIVSVDGNGAIIPGDFSGDTNPPSENDYSIAAVISYGDFDEWIGGDLDGQYEVGGFGYTYHDIELSVAPEVGDVDVYKVNHHASTHSSSSTFINQIDPEVSVVTVGDGNTYGHPTQLIMDRLLATSTVYTTERGDTNTDIGSAIVAGNIVIKTTDGSSYTVNGTSYTATEPTRTDADGDGYFAEADPNDGSNSIIPSPNGGCGLIYQTCSVSCEVSVGQVLINEILPSPFTGPEWVELYNATNSTVNLGYCYIDDIVGGSSPYQIPIGTLIPAYGFWTLDRTSYFNNTGDDVRFLKEDNSTVLDSFTISSTDYDLSWYRYPDGQTWAKSPTASTTKGQTNNTSVKSKPSIPVLLSPLNSKLLDTLQPALDWKTTKPVAYRYQLQVSTNSSFKALVLDETHLSSSDFGFTSDLDPGKKYFWRVRAFNYFDQTKGWSTVWNFRTPLDKPILELPVCGTSLLTDRPVFDWGDVDGAAKYALQISRHPTNFGTTYLQFSKSVTVSELSMPRDLPQNKTLYWRVQAKNSVVKSSWSDICSSTTGNPPSVPVLRSPANGVLVKTYLPTLKWYPSKLPSGTTFKRYELQVDDDSNFSSPVIEVSITDGVITETSYIPLSELIPNTKYYWRVRAVNLVGANEHVSGWSKAWNFRTVMLAPVLLSPTNGSTETSLKPLFDWEDVDGATSYMIQISTSANFSTFLVNTKRSVSNFTPSTNLPKNKVIYWRVRANGPNGPSAWSKFQFSTPQ